MLNLVALPRAVFGLGIARIWAVAVLPNPAPCRYGCGIALGVCLAVWLPESRKSYPPFSHAFRFC